MKIVLVTGKVACEHVEEIARKLQRSLSVFIEVICLPIPVAAMISAEYLKRELPRHVEKISGASLIMVPGFSSGDMSEVSKIIGVEVVKGPKYATDIPLALELLLKGVKLSSKDPADEVIGEFLRAREAEILNEARRRSRDKSLFYIGDLPVSSEYPLVVGELYVNEEFGAPRSVMEQADVVVVGATYGSSAERIKPVIERVRLAGKPVGLDTPDYTVLEELLDVVELVNAIPSDDLEWVLRKEEKLKNKVLVLTSPQVKPGERVSTLLGAYNQLRNRGFKRLVLDPVLSPPLSGLAESLQAYSMLKRVAPEVPVLMGVGNVTELSDVDSVGLNALLAFIGVEIGVELFLTTEASPKTRGCVSELRRALNLAVLARDTRKPPKDFSVNMLYLKSKKRVPTPPRIPGVSVTATNVHKSTPDPKGYFRIWVDHEEGTIVLQHYERSSTQPKLEIRGSDPFAILKTVLDMDLLSRLDHAFYLGYEVAKARIALKTGREYEQDRELF